MMLLADIRKVLSIPFKYRKSIAYTLKKKGIFGVYNFMFTKYFVADEGGEISIMNPVITRLPSLASYPYKLDMEHTTTCNKRCILCEHTYWKEPPERLDLDGFKKILDNFPKLKWTNITGLGSGFLNPDFMKILEYAAGRGVSVNFVDEMDFIDEGKARKLIEIGVNSIVVSMDGATKETYEKIKVGCNFERAIENIKNILKIKEELGSPFPVISFRFVVNKINYNEMPKMVELVHSLGDLGEGAKLDFVGVLKFPAIENYYMEEIPKEVLDETIKKAAELKVHIALTHHEQEKLLSINDCPAWQEPYLMIGGYALPCCSVLMSNKRDTLRERAFGNVNEKTFKEIWNSERYKKFRKAVNKKNGKVPLLCSGCRGYDTREREKKYGIDETL